MAFETGDWGFSSIHIQGESPGASPELAARTSIDGGRYEILGELGRGGMGVVFRGRERGSRREVAIKLVLKETGTRRARFEREGMLAALLDHPGIVRVHSAGRDGDCPFLVYELVEDPRSLSEVLPDLSLRKRVELLRDVADALGYAHSQGIIHRDIKPGNILVDTEGNPRVTDFGLATALGLGRLTRTGVVLGTATHMPPEQIDRELGDPCPASDVWSVGVILYWALTGSLPFQASTWLELVGKVMRLDPEPPRAHDPEIPTALEAVCLRCLEKRPADRYVDGRALARDLNAWLEGQPVSASHASSVVSYLRRRRRGLALALIALAAVGLAAALPAALSGGRPHSGKPGPSPASVTLEVPHEGQELRGSELVLRGRVRPPHYGAIARIGTQQLTIPDGGAFELRVTLPEGEHQIVLQATDPAGQPSGPSLTRRVRCLALPTWFERQASPPPLPLPQGIRCGGAPGEYVARDGSILVWIPPGRFSMGRSPSAPDEIPPHEVVFSEGYYIGKYELTWGQLNAWRREMGLPEGGRAVDSRIPATHLSWTEARDYCAWAGLRLPTEAEWEYAAKGRDGRHYPWGNTFPEGFDRTLANVSPHDRSDKQLPERVGSYPGDVSPFGCLDMGGNVSEWVYDWYALYPDGTLTDPRGPAAPPPGETPRRVRRGGCYHRSGASSRTTGRLPLEPDGRQPDTGVRVAASPR